MNRRKFLGILGIGAVALALPVKKAPHKEVFTHRSPSQSAHVIMPRGYSKSHLMSRYTKSLAGAMRDARDEEIRRLLK